MATDPGTRSPGSIYLVYVVNSIQHTVGARYIDGVNIQDVPTCRTDATNFAAKFKDVLPTPIGSITGWGLRGPDGSPAYEEPFTTPIAGTHAASGSAWASLTLTMTGLGIATTVGGAHGKTRMVMFLAPAYTVAPGSKASTINFDAAMTALSVFLRDSLRMWADKFGQKAAVHNKLSIQFNAKAQRTIGS